MKRNCLILTVLIVASICFLHGGYAVQAVAAGADPTVKDIEGNPAGNQPKTSAGLPADGVYSKDAGRGGSYKDPINGFFVVQAPAGFEIKERFDKTKFVINEGSSHIGETVPASFIQFVYANKTFIAVTARKTFTTIEHDFDAVLDGLPKKFPGIKIDSTRFITIDGVKGGEILASLSGQKLLMVKYKKYGLDHSININCDEADFPKFEDKFVAFLRSYRSLKSEQGVKQADGEPLVEPLQQDDKKQAVELKKTESIAETVPASIKGGPEITFEKVVHDFGNIKPGSKNVCEFKFTNTGDSLLKITEVSKSCGCTPYTLAKMEYEPNESGSLKVEYHASTQPVSVKKTLFVSSNDEAKPRVELVIKAEIVSKMDYQPKNLDLSLNKENAGCPAITIKSFDGKPFSIKGFKAIGQLKPIENAITADYNSSVEATEFVLQPKVDIEKLRVELSGRIEITLTHPESDVISIPFEVLPRFKITPPSLIVKAEPGKPATREVWILSNYDEDFEVESTSTQEGAIKVLSQEKIDNRYKVELEITPPATEKGRRGFFTDTFFVNIKGGEILKIPCRMVYVRKAEKSPPTTEKLPPATEKSPSTN
jgi:hypothetical protein